MPWINSEMCTGCGVCIDECSVGAIAMQGDVACIDEPVCIRCGVCHDVCPSDAVRHDGERIPHEVAANLAWAGRLLGHAYYMDDPKKQAELRERLKRYFTKQMRVAEKTLSRLPDVTAASRQEQ